MTKFLKFTQEDSLLPSGQVLPKKIKIFAILSYLSPHFYVYIMLKFCLRERTVESLNDTKGILACCYCIASEVMHRPYLFLVPSLALFSSVRGRQQLSCPVLRLSLAVKLSYF